MERFLQEPRTRDALVLAAVPEAVERLAGRRLATIAVTGDLEAADASGSVPVFTAAAPAVAGGRATLLEFAVTAEKTVVFAATLPAGGVSRCGRSSA
jgi:hypothetical protein